MIRIINNNLGRALHNNLYQRLIDFCKAYTPELPGEKQVALWLQRIYLGDNTVHILCNLDQNYNITSHCLIALEQWFDDVIVYCYQLQTDKKDKSFLMECIDYARKLKAESNAIAIMFTVTDNIKAYQKLGFKSIRHIMLENTALYDSETLEE